jgi:RND family efflux transporter MFP subunit
MRNFLIVSLSVSLILIGACSKSEPPPRPEVARPAKLYTVEGPDAFMLRSFPGEVEASDTADMAFRVNGRITEFPAARGMEVKKGDILAQLDPADYQAIVNQAQAQYDLAVAQFDRAAELIDRQLIAQAEYDERLALRQVRQSNLTTAKNNLRYTRLEAPFDGVVARRDAENFENVQAGQVVLVLQTQTMVDISVAVPENIISRLERQPVNDRKGEVKVRFGARDEEFTAYYKEHESDADSATLTFKVTFSMPAPEGMNVLPGMSATVIADLSSLYRSIASELTMIPIEAVYSAETEPLDSEERHVWVVDPETMRATDRRVRVGQLTGNRIAILKGLEPGELIVAAGVNTVTEGMLLRRMQRERGL